MKKPTMGGVFRVFCEKTRVGWAFSKKVGFLPTLGDSDSADGISGSHPGLYCLQGFSCPEESREASLHWRRILVLRPSASVILAGVIRGAVLNDSTTSWGSPPH